ncbi:nucleoside phosphorylase domain-containing protein [Chaetomium sp. MPI-CAGE-AT-0009]|nr:nucleoside phosphorylase domain-containing protein [Chaetomium sp. MPI-CAGE-AT-0009]
MGIVPTTRVAMKLQRDFKNLRFCLVVGVAGGCPDPGGDVADIRLGDVVVSQPKDGRGGVVQIDMGKNTDSGFKTRSHLNKAYEVLLNALVPLKNAHDTTRNMDLYLDEVAKKSQTQPELRKFAFPGRDRDRLFLSDYSHPSEEPTCAKCDEKHAWKRPPRQRRPEVFYGTIGSANHVLRSARERDKLRRQEGILCVEMEAAAVMDTLPSMVIRGICDYADSHKNKEWQPYAALTAAAYAKDLLAHVKKTPPPRIHGDHCVLGVVRVDDVDRALAADPKAFRRDLAELAAACRTTTHFSKSTACGTPRTG